MISFRELLTWADDNRWAIFSNDEDFPILAAFNQRSGTEFGCAFYARQDVHRSGEDADWLETHAKLETWETMRSRVTYVP